MKRLLASLTQSVAAILPAAALGLALPSASFAQEQHAHAEAREHKGLSILTLGTAGGPPPHQGRSQPATLIMVDGKKYLFDAGEAAGYQLLQAGIPPRALDAIFITHLHWDHTLGLDYLMATEWMRGRSDPLPVHGPPGLDFLMSRQLATLELGEDIFRAQAKWRPALASLFPSREVAECGVTEVFRDEKVVISSVCNSHFAHVAAAPHSYGPDKSLSYRVDTPYGSVTLTGDSGVSADLDKLAAGSDVLVSEIVDTESINIALDMAAPGKDNSLLKQHMAEQHLSASQVADIATQAGVKTVILTHFVVGNIPDLAPIGAEVEKHFKGKVIVGKDLQRYQIR